MIVSVDDKAVTEAARALVAASQTMVPNDCCRMPITLESAKQRVMYDLVFFLSQRAHGIQLRNVFDLKALEASPDAAHIPATEKPAT